MLSRKSTTLFVTLMVTIVLTGCAEGSNPLVNQPDPTGHISGFLDGLFHGWLIVLAFIGSALGGDYQIYDVHNNGVWYNLGFLMGIGAFSSTTKKVVTRTVDNRGYVIREETREE